MNKNDYLNFARVWNNTAAYSNREGVAKALSLSENFYHRQGTLAYERVCQGAPR